MSGKPDEPESTLGPLAKVLSELESELAPEPSKLDVPPERAPPDKGSDSEEPTKGDGPPPNP